MKIAPWVASIAVASFVRRDAIASIEIAIPSEVTAIPPGGKKSQHAAAKTLRNIAAKTADSVVCPQTPSPRASGADELFDCTLAVAANGEPTLPDCVDSLSVVPVAGSAANGDPTRYSDCSSKAHSFLAILRLCG